MRLVLYVQASKSFSNVRFHTQNAVPLVLNTSQSVSEDPLSAAVLFLASEWSANSLEGSSVDDDVLAVAAASFDSFCWSLSASPPLGLFRLPSRLRLRSRFLSRLRDRLPRFLSRLLLLLSRLRDRLPRFLSRLRLRRLLSLRLRSRLRDLLLSLVDRDPPPSTGLRDRFPRSAVDDFPRSRLRDLRLSLSLSLSRSLSLRSPRRVDVSLDDFSRSSLFLMRSASASALALSRSSRALTRASRRSARHVRSLAYPMCCLPLR